MIPDEESKDVSGPAPAAPEKGRRRTRRGGRRHSRPRGPRPPHSPSPDTAGVSELTEVAEPAEVSAPAGEPEIASAAAFETKTEPGPKLSGVSEAIEQVTRIVDELKRVLDEMEEVLETLELAERQKIDDEREIESLQRALRQLHRPGPGASSRR